MLEFRTTPSKSNGVGKHRLLIGEANPSLREYLLAVLRSDGHEVVAMASGLDLLDTLAVSLHPEFGHMRRSGRDRWRRKWRRGWFGRPAESRCEAVQATFR